MCLTQAAQDAAEGSCGRAYGTQRGQVAPVVGGCGRSDGELQDQAWICIALLAGFIFGMVCGAMLVS